jgi:lipopolysaccharide/colanic/teichoic acid biosynthesis glycosyltransferase
MLSASKEHEVASEGPFAATRSRGLQRAFDITCAATGLVILSPLFCAIAVAIKFDDAGPVFYGQERVGKSFRAFRICKFRTMVSGADRHGLLTVGGDSRLTRMGQVLRRYKLDELPQLFNVLMGDMQLVGARPEVDRYVQMFRPEYAVILQDRPGITDPASLAYRHEEQMLSTSRTEQQYLKEILPTKLRISMDYQRRRNFLSDIGILIKTVFGIST